MKKASSRALTPAQKGELKRLQASSDGEIDTGDIPEVLDWSAARRGVFYRPVKQQLTLRLDADVIDWFKKTGTGYQTRINSALREFVRRQARKAAS